MKKSAVIVILLVIFILAIMEPVSGQLVDLRNNSNAIVWETFYKAKDISFTTKNYSNISESITIVTNNQTINISRVDWGKDDSRFGAMFKVSNGSTEILTPLEKRWGAQVVNIKIGSTDLTIGLTKIFPESFAELCISVWNK